MFAFDSLALPIVAAPMAGGPSTPELVAAVTQAGGFGYLAGGYLSVDALAERIAATRALLGSRPFGVNLFVPGEDPMADPATAGRLDAYARALAGHAQALGATLGRVSSDDDGWPAKLDLLHRDPVAVVSFTFGLPSPAEVATLHEAGSCLVATVVTERDAVAAAERGVDALCVQGPEAGGHRGTLSVAQEPPEVPLLELVAAVRSVVDLPIVAAGGLTTPEAVRAALAAGAVAAQVGTGFLRTPEAGTSATHRAALVDPRFTQTSITRAFSGRPARALRNRLVAEHEDAPAVYPQVNQMTGALRKAAAAAGDADRLHLWAGTGWRAARAEPAAEVARALGGPLD